MRAYFDNPEPAYDILLFMKASDLSRIALMSVVICVCAWISIPLAIPFTMQTFGVFLSLILLNSKNGSYAIALYILMGIVGIPVYSGFNGGIGHLLGPTGGYIIGFLFMGLIFSIGEKKRTSVKLDALMLILALVVCYLIGTLWFVAVSKSAKSFSVSLMICVVPYIIPDLCKLLLALYLGNRLKKYINKVH